VSLPPIQQLFDQHRDEVYRFLVFTAGPGEAPDCFQETMLAALRAYPKLRDDKNLRGWLFTIAHRKAIDGHRTRARRAVPAAALPGSVLPERAAPNVEIEDPALWAAVRRLPEKQRAAVVLRFVADLPYARIAAITGGTEAAARQNVRAGLVRLREDWTP
jgi:RNA polymerase sigma factor (sigma-70 family)